MTGTPPPGEPPRHRAGIPVWFVPAGALVLLVIFTVVYEMATRGSSNFIRPENLINILRQWSFVGIMAVGMTFIITLGGIDLSVGSLVAFLGGLGILLMNSVITAPEVMAASVDAAARLADGGEPAAGAPGAVAVALARTWTLLRVDGSELTGVLLAMALMLTAGTLAGVVNGVLVTVGRVAPFIATLGGLAAYRSLALAMASGGEYRSASSDLFARLGTGGIPIPFTNVAPRAPEPIPLLLPWPVIVFTLVAIAGAVVLHRTAYGRRVIAVGCNERAAIYSAINVTRVKVFTYALLGLCTGIAAVLLSSRMNSISSSGSGVLYELDVIAAVVIGGTSMRGGRGTIVGTVIGVLILGVVGNMLNLLQVSPYLQGLVKGLIIVGAVLLQRAERVP